MKVWEKVDCIADGVVYACGNKRKLIIPGRPVIYYEVDAGEVRWHRDNGNGKSDRVSKDK